MNKIATMLKQAFVLNLVLTFKTLQQKNNKVLQKASVTDLDVFWNLDKTNRMTLGDPVTF